jgi:hypothetical protein
MAYPVTHPTKILVKGDSAAEINPNVAAALPNSKADWRNALARLSLVIDMSVNHVALFIPREYFDCANNIQ